MSRADWVFFALIVLGVIFFLIGANYWNDVVGWLGVFLITGSIVIWVLLYVYRSLEGRHAPKPEATPQTTNQIGNA
jgi:drug/metabolite transporter (DMT)-like permease